MTLQRKTFLAGVAALALAAFVVFLLKPDAQGLLRLAQERLVRAKSVHLAAQGSFSGVIAEAGASSAAIGSELNLTFSLESDVERSNPQQPASRSTFRFEEKGANAARRLAGEARRKDNRYYANLSEAEGLGLDTMKDRLIGRWVVADRPLTNWLIPPSDASSAEHPLDAAGLDAFQLALTNVSLLKPVGEPKTERIDGIAVRRVPVEMDMDALAALLFKLRELRTGKEVTQDDAIRISAEIVRWGQPAGEAWIGKKDGRFRRVHLASAVVLEGAATRIEATVDFTKYDAPLAIEAPGDAQPLEDLLGALPSDRLRLAGERGPLASATASGASGLPETPFMPGGKDSDGDGMEDGQESFYGTDPWNPDTDGDGWTDGHEVTHGMNPAGPGPLFGFGL